MIYLTGLSVRDVDEWGDVLLRSAPCSHFSAVKLHDRSRRCWAVVGYPSGAIAEDANGDLLMRLTQDEAHTRAKERAADLSSIGSYQRPSFRLIKLPKR